MKDERAAEATSAQTAGPWWSYWGAVESAAACDAKRVIRDYMRARSSLVSDPSPTAAAHASGPAAAKFTDSLNRLDNPVGGAVHAATFWQTTIASATDANAVAYVWSVDTFGLGRTDSQDGYTVQSTSAYRLARDDNALQVVDSTVLETTAVHISAEARTSAIDLFQTYVTKWAEARLARDTVVLADVAVGDELLRLQSAIVQAPTNTRLTAVHFLEDMTPLGVSASQMLMAITQSRNETHALQRGETQSDTYADPPRLVRFISINGRWLAQASEPLESDDPDAVTQAACA
jgi:hypothetical protein